MDSKINLKSLYLLLFCFLTNISFGQISLNMPVERSVFQRVNNKATIQIGGTIFTSYTEIQVKLEVIQGGSAIDWTTVKTNLSPGVFRCEIPDVEAGWYELEVRGLQNGTQIGAIAEISKVGVGEVIMIMGQSNAQGGRPPYDQGYYDFTFYGAHDDRVNCVNYYESSANVDYPMPVISQLQAETNIAPHGKASWCWGLLGDKIAQNWNVPVLFFNAAETSTTANTWSNSANGDLEWPYIFFKKSLAYYCKIYGLRGVLWHQGESDLFNFNETIYYNSLVNVINKSREDFNNNISWVIARVSRIGNFTKEELKQTQQNIASIPNFNTFLGPDTDVIQPGEIYRDDYVHFRGTGFIELANAWYNSLMSSNFIYNSNPIAGSNNLQVINNQFVIGPNLQPCNGVIETINSGFWNNPAIWSCGIVPEIIHDVIIKEGHSISIDNHTASAKSITNNGTLSFSNGGLLLLGQ